MNDLLKTLNQLQHNITQTQVALQEAIDRLNQLEPRNEHTDAYDHWAQLHEDLEDVLDDILDSLD